jgi:general stress protein 26
MEKPELKPIAPSDLISFAVETMRDAKFPTLASMDGDQARVRPVSPVRTDGFTVYVANLKMYHKTQEIAVNPKVELCYFAENHNQVRITGEAKVLTDREMLEAIWEANPLLRKYLGSIENPALVVYRIEPTQVRYMVEWALEYYDVPLA